jgi:hypothetical protein
MPRKREFGQQKALRSGAAEPPLKQLEFTFPPSGPLLVVLGRDLELERTARALLEALDMTELAFAAQLGAPNFGDTLSR